MLDLPTRTNARRLTDEEKAQYHELGYVKGLPAFAPDAVPALQAGYEALEARMPPGVDITRVNCWHKASRWFYDVCQTPAILDYVEDLLGPTFFQWGGQFFVKFPGDGTEVPWHQDAQYWPLSPRRSVTVWLAVYDADEDNAAMQVVAGSHREGELPHHTNDASHLVLNQEADESVVDPDRVVMLNLKAGEISLHDDGLLHGSGANLSDRKRVGLAMRFAPPQVECDLSVWPNFEAYPSRGDDPLRLNPVGPVPTCEAYPVRLFQHSSEFTAMDESMAAR